MNTSTVISMQLADSLLGELDREGVVALPGLISGAELSEMRAVFGSRVKHLRWSDSDGYERTERYRHMVQDVPSRSIKVLKDNFNIKNQLGLNPKETP